MCLSDSCITVYPDTDGDGFGASAGVNHCGTGPTAGFVSNASDCCDSDGSAKPGQTNYSTTPRAGCGGYDFNCDNTEDALDLTENACQPDGNNCLHCGTLAGWQFNTPACGEESTYVTACDEMQVGCTTACGVTCDSCGNPQTQTRTQGCR